MLPPWWRNGTGILEAVNGGWKLPPLLASKGSYIAIRGSCFARKKLYYYLLFHTGMRYISAPNGIVLALGIRRIGTVHKLVNKVRLISHDLDLIGLVITEDWLCSDGCPAERELRPLPPMANNGVLSPPQVLGFKAPTQINAACDRECAQTDTYCLLTVAKCSRMREHRAEQLQQWDGAVQ